MFKFVRSIVIAALLGLALVTPTFAQFQSPAQAIRLDHGLVYNFVTTNGDTVNLIGDGKVYNIVLLHSITRATENHIDTILPTKGDPEKAFYSAVKLTAQDREALLSAEQNQTGTFQMRLDHGLVYNFVTTNGDTVNLIGDGKVYNIVLLHSITRATENHIDTILPTKGDPEKAFYSAVKLTAQDREALLAN